MRSHGAVRPHFSAWLLDWVTREPLKREWFFEQRDGNCDSWPHSQSGLRTQHQCGHERVAPVAEWVSRELWSRQRKWNRDGAPPTRLTQLHKREAKGSLPQPHQSEDSDSQPIAMVAAKKFDTGTRTVRPVRPRSKPNENEARSGRPPCRKLSRCTCGNDPTLFGSDGRTSRLVAIEPARVAH